LRRGGTKSRLSPFSWSSRAGENQKENAIFSSIGTTRLLRTLLLFSTVVSFIRLAVIIVADVVLLRLQLAISSITYIIVAVNSQIQFVLFFFNASTIQSTQYNISLIAYSSNTTSNLSSFSTFHPIYLTKLLLNPPANRRKKQNDDDDQ